jgi:hypothetical protein
MEMKQKSPIEQLKKSPIEQLKLELEDSEEEKKDTEPHVEEVDFETMIARAREDLEGEEKLMYGHEHKK